MTGPTTKTLEQVWNRDQGRCALCGDHIVGERGRDWSLHHRRPRSMGGSKLPWVNLPANLILLHGSGTTGCHFKIERQRVWATEMGFLVSANGLLRADQKDIDHAVHGTVFLHDDGSWLAA